MHPIKGEILSLRRSDGGGTAGELADTLDISPVMVRQHVTALDGMPGLPVASRLPVGRSANRLYQGNGPLGRWARGVAFR